MPDPNRVISFRSRWVVATPSSKLWPPPAMTGNIQKWYSSTK